MALYFANDKKYDIPLDRESEFLLSFPNAEKMNRYFTDDGKEYDIPESRQQDFMQQFPTAKTEMVESPPLPKVEIPKIEQAEPRTTENIFREYSESGEYRELYERKPEFDIPREEAKQDATSINEFVKKYGNRLPQTAEEYQELTGGQQTALTAFMKEFGSNLPLVKFSDLLMSTGEKDFRNQLAQKHKTATIGGSIVGSVTSLIWLGTTTGLSGAPLFMLHTALQDVPSVISGDITVKDLGINLVEAGVLGTFFKYLNVGQSNLALKLAEKYGAKTVTAVSEIAGTAGLFAGVTMLDIGTQLTKKQEVDLTAALTKGGIISAFHLLGTPKRLKGTFKNAKQVDTHMKNTKAFLDKQNIPYTQEDLALYRKIAVRLIKHKDISKVIKTLKPEEQARFNKSRQSVTGLLPEKPEYTGQYRAMKKEFPHREPLAKNRVRKYLSKISGYVGKGEYDKAKVVEGKFRTYLGKLESNNVLSREKMDNTYSKIDDLTAKIEAGEAIIEKPTEVPPVKKEAVKKPEIKAEKKPVDQKPTVKEKVEKPAVKYVRHGKSIDKVIKETKKMYYFEDGTSARKSAKGTYEVSESSVKRFKARQRGGRKAYIAKTKDKTIIPMKDIDNMPYTSLIFGSTVDKGEAQKFKGIIVKDGIINKSILQEAKEKERVDFDQFHEGQEDILQELGLMTIDQELKPHVDWEFVVDKAIQEIDKYIKHGGKLPDQSGLYEEDYERATGESGEIKAIKDKLKKTTPTRVYDLQLKDKVTWLDEYTGEKHTGVVVEKSDETDILFIQNDVSAEFDMFDDRIFVEKIEKATKKEVAEKKEDFEELNKGVEELGEQRLIETRGKLEKALEEKDEKVIQEKVVEAPKKAEVKKEIKQKPELENVSVYDVKVGEKLYKRTGDEYEVIKITKSADKVPIKQMYSLKYLNPPDNYEQTRLEIIENGNMIERYYYRKAKIKPKTVEQLRKEKEAKSPEISTQEDMLDTFAGQETLKLEEVDSALQKEEKPEVTKQKIVKEEKEVAKEKGITEKDVPVLKAYGALNIPTRSQKIVLLKDKAVTVLNKKLDHAEITGDLDAMTNINKKIKSEKRSIENILKQSNQEYDLIEMYKNSGVKPKRYEFYKRLDNIYPDITAKEKNIKYNDAFEPKEGVAGEAGFIRIPESQNDKVTTTIVKESLELPEESFIRKVQRKIQNSMNRSVQLVKEAKKMDNVRDAENFAQKAELFIGRASSRVDDLTKEFSIREKGSFTRELVDAGFDIEHLGEYLYAQFAGTRNEQISIRSKGKKKSGSGITDVEAEKILNHYKNTGIDKYARDFRKRTTQKSLKLFYDAGFITKKSYDILIKQTDVYVPLKKVPGNKALKIKAGTGSGYSVPSRGIFRAKGRTTLADNPMIQSIIDHEELIVRAEKNKIGLSLLQFIKKFPNKDIYTVKKQRYIPSYNKYGEIDFYNKRYSLEVNEISVWKDGEQHIITIHDVPLVKGLKKIGLERSVKYLNSINNYLRTVITMASPEFALRNFQRDIQTALINITKEDVGKIHREVVKNTPAAIKGVFEALRGKHKSYYAKEFKVYREVGAKTGWFENINLEDKIAKFEKQIRQYRRGGNIMGAARGTLFFIEDMNEAVENGVRLATYDAFRKRGFSVDKSASIAKNVTVNFNKKGEWGALLNSLYLFSNASIQGTAIIYQALKNSKVRAIAVGLMAMGFFLNYINRQIDEEEFEYLDAYVRDSNWVYILPNGKHLKFRLPFGYSFFVALGGISADAVYGDLKMSDAMKRIFVAGVDAFNPFGSTSSLMQLIAPTFIDPIVQISENKTFYGSPLRPEQPPYQPKVPESQLYFDSVRKNTKLVTDWLNRVTRKKGNLRGEIDINPENIDHLIDFVAGGLGKTLANTLEMGTTLVTEGKFPALNKIPFLRVFYGEGSEYAPRRIIYATLQESGRTKISKTKKDKFLKALRKARKDKQITAVQHKSYLEKFDLAQQKLNEALKRGE